jgi:hypothetical protein
MMASDELSELGRAVRAPNVAGMADANSHRRLADDGGGATLGAGLPSVAPIGGVMKAHWFSGRDARLPCRPR